jgi:hypothetical protein
LDQNLQFQNRIGTHPSGVVAPITQFNHAAAYGHNLALQTRLGQVNLL